MNTTTQVALVVVDVQRDVMAESVNADRVVATIAGLVECARALAVPVIWVRHNADDELTLGSDGWQIVDDLAPADGEPIVEKRYADAFAGTDLASRLSQADAEALVLCGAQTDACIRSTFFGAIHRGYDVMLVADAHTTGDMRPWGMSFGPDDSIAVLNAWAAHTETPDAKGIVLPAEAVFAG